MGPGLPRLDLLHLNLRDVCEVGILRKDDQAVPEAGRRDPGIHHARTAAGGSGLRDDRGEGMSDLRIDGNRLEFALNPGNGPKTPGSGGSVLGKKHTQMQLRQGNDRDRRLVG